MKTIELWQLNDFCGVIVPCKSGFLWTNQVGGTATYHPIVEGIYLPLAAYSRCPTCGKSKLLFDVKRNDDLLLNYSDFPTPDEDERRFRREQIRLIKRWVHSHELNNSFAEPLLAFLCEHNLQEAWVPLRIRCTERSPEVLKPFDSSGCIFTYENSD